MVYSEPKLYIDTRLLGVYIGGMVDVAELAENMGRYFAGNLVLVDGKWVMSAETPTIEGWCADNDLTLEEFRDLCNKNGELDRARQIAYQRWEHMMMNGGLSGAMSGSAWGLVMKNKAGYADKSEVSTTVKRVVDISEIEGRLGRILDGEFGRLPSVMAAVEVIAD